MLKYHIFSARLFPSRFLMEYCGTSSRTSSRSRSLSVSRIVLIIPPAYNRNGSFRIRLLFLKTAATIRGKVNSIRRACAGQMRTQAKHRMQALVSIDNSGTGLIACMGQLRTQAPQAVQELLTTGALVSHRALFFGMRYAKSGIDDGMRELSRGGCWPCMRARAC